MIKVVTAFVTTDDKMHMTKEDAIKHQKVIDLTSQAIEFAKVHYPTDIEPVTDIIVKWEQEKPLPQVTLTMLGLSQRAYLALNSANITSVEGLVQYSITTLREFPNMNIKIANEIQDALVKHGLSLMIDVESKTT